MGCLGGAHLMDNLGDMMQHLYTTVEKSMKYSSVTEEEMLESR
jgi:hypothetical protein